MGHAKMKLQKIEKELLEKFFSKRGIEKDYINKLHVVSREHTGSGEYVYLDGPPHEKLREFDEANFISDEALYFQIGDNSYSCLFWEEKNKVSFLEIFCNGYEDYPHDPQDYIMRD